MDWDRMYEEYYHEEPNKDVIKFCDSLGSNSAVLDIGIGSGRHIGVFLDRNLNAYGFDISGKAVEESKKKYPKASLVKHDMLSWPWPYEDDFFDATISINTLHHCNYSQYRKSVDEIYRILKKGGLALLTVVSKKNHKFKQGEKVDSRTYISDDGAEKGIPHVFMDKKDIMDIFKEFKIQKVEETSTYVPVSDWNLKDKKGCDQWLVLLEK